jgi:uncharacterized membrane protein YadS
MIQSRGNEKLGVWSSLLRREDWWAVWLGFLIITLALTRTITWMPKYGRWENNPLAVLTLGEISSTIFLGVFLLISTFIAIWLMRENKGYALGFPLIFFLAFLSILLSKQKTIGAWGLEYAIWALMSGLLISNTIGLPGWLKHAVRTELFIKTGLVLLGAEILFNDLLAAGAAGVFEITVGLLTVWYFCYYLATRLGLSKSFASILASATSICGVSAAITAGGAVKGDPKEVSYTISLVLLFAMPMLVLMPAIGGMLELPEAVVGAWIGGTIDTTPAVVAAGAFYGEKAMRVASIVKMSQNMMIGVAAFILALYWTVKVERKPEERPRPMEIWFRFPKFVVGFLIASLLFSLILVPTMGYASVKGVLGITSGIRAWLFSMAFVSIGLGTKFKELIKIGAGKPFLVFLAASIFDIAISLVSAYLFFGGVFFPPPI